MSIVNSILAIGARDKEFSASQFDGTHRETAFRTGEADEPGKLCRVGYKPVARRYDLR